MTWTRLDMHSKLTSAPIMKNIRNPGHSNEDSGGTQGRKCDRQEPSTEIPWFSHPLENAITITIHCRMRLHCGQIRCRLLARRLESHVGIMMIGTSSRPRLSAESNRPLRLGCTDRSRVSRGWTTAGDRRWLVVVGCGTEQQQAARMDPPVYAEAEEALLATQAAEKAAKKKKKKEEKEKDARGVQRAQYVITTNFFASRR